MKAPKFAKLFAQLPLLNQPQRRQVLDALHPAAGLDRVVALIDEIRSSTRRCPECACEHCHRHGQANDLQRFRCCACGRTFNDLTGTPLARLRHKGKWLDYLETVLDSRTVRSAAKRVGVHRNTAFRWRHRFLERVKDDRPARLSGIVEADETFLLESQKGSRKLDRPPRKRGGRAALCGISHHLDCILVARDRNGQTIDAVTGRGALKAAHLVKHLLPKLAPQALLVPTATPRIPLSPGRMASRIRRSISEPANESARASTAPSISRTSMPITGASRNGWRVSMAWRRADCRTIWAGIGHAMADESLPSSNCCASRSESSTAKDDSAWRDGAA